MKVKDEIKEQLMDAMFNLVKAINKETDNCGKASGGFNEKEQIILYYLGSHEDANMSDLAEITDAPMSTVTSIVNKLVENGFLNRDHSDEDRRVIHITLSAKGKTVYSKIQVQKDAISHSILSRLTDKDQVAMIKYINLLASSLGKG